MDKITVKGHEFKAPLIRDSFDRRATQYKNSIFESLRKIGIGEDDVNVPVQLVAYKRGRAFVSFYLEHTHLYYSYNRSRKFVENLAVVLKVIELEVNAVFNKEKTVEQFIIDFSEDEKIEDHRKKSRELLGVEEECNDIDIINQNYKKMAKEHHPDVDGGSQR